MCLKPSVIPSVGPFRQRVYKMAHAATVDACGSLLGILSCWVAVEDPGGGASSWAEEHFFHQQASTSVECQCSMQLTTPRGWQGPVATPRDCQRNTSTALICPAIVSCCLGLAPEGRLFVRAGSCLGPRSAHFTSPPLWMRQVFEFCTILKPSTFRATAV